MDFEVVKNRIYPWVKRDASNEITDNQDELFVDIIERPFLGDLFIVFVVDLEDHFEVLQRNQVPKYVSDQQLYEIAIQNLSNNIKFTLQPTNYGGYGLLAGGDHEAAAICLDYLWDFCSDEIGEDLIISIPSKDIVLMVGVSQSHQLEAMKKLSREIIEDGDRTLSQHLFLYDKLLRQFSIYE